MHVPLAVLTEHTDMRDMLTGVSMQPLVSDVPELLLKIFTCFMFIKKTNKDKNRNELNASNVMVVTQAYSFGLDGMGASYLSSGEACRENTGHIYRSCKNVSLCFA
jgi:hypothetical protein